MNNACLSVVNRTLSATVRKQEKEIAMLRRALMIACVRVEIDVEEGHGL